jgi:alpha/beta superfamily hydrolase
VSATLSTFELSLSGPVGSLAARLVTPAEPTRRAVVAHPHPLYGGTMDNAVVRWTVERLAAAGAAVLAFDFRGVRRSDGVHDGGDGERHDLVAAERELERRHPGLPHWIAGYSFGASTCLGRLALGGEADAATPVVDALLLLAPPLSAHALDPRLATVPTAVVTGERDGLTPAPELERFVAALADLRYRASLPDAAHDLGTAGPPGPGALGSALDDAIERLGFGD